MKQTTVELLQESVHRITFSTGKTCILVGTAHVSAQSVQLVDEIIREYKPETVCIELDQQRHDALVKKTSWEELDIIQIIRKKQLFFLIGQFILASFQKKIAEKTGSAPGEEFKTAIKVAEETGADVACIDRNIGITLKRAWRLTTFRKKLALLWGLLTEDSDEIDETSIEELKSMDAINTLIEGFEQQLPETKKILIDERDRFLLGSLMEYQDKNTVAVVGAGHVPGMLSSLDSPPEYEEMEEINSVPEQGVASRVLPWVIPALVIGLIGWGFTRGNYDKALEVMGYWVLVNGTLSALGCILALAHPVTIISGFIAAPITSLNPTIGAGFVTSLVQAFLVRPRVLDLKQIQENALGIRDWWKNRVTRIFLVFILSSVGSSIGTFVALPALRKLFG